MKRKGKIRKGKIRTIQGKLKKIMKKYRIKRKSEKKTFTLLNVKKKNIQNLFVFITIIISL